jgi:hypothetical protein
VRLVRHRAIRLFVLLLCAWSFLAPPLCASPRSRKAVSVCSCPMCRAIGGGGHCACCDEGKCSCHLSSGDNDALLVLATQPAVVSNPVEFGIILPFEKLDPAVHHKIDMPDLAIPAPPPKGTPGI